MKSPFFKISFPVAVALLLGTWSGAKADTKAEADEMLEE